MCDTVCLGMGGKGVTIKEEIFAADSTLVVDDINNVIHELSILLLVVSDGDTVKGFCV